MGPPAAADDGRFVHEIHDTDHPIGSSLYHEDQRRGARARTANFAKSRMPKYLGCFERVLERKTAPEASRRAELSYPDLSLFQVVADLRYAFPRARAKARAGGCLHDAVAARPCIAAYRNSGRCIAFNEHGIFRHYPELDTET